MTEWWKDEGVFRIKGLALVRKSPSFHPHSVIPRHSWMTKLIGMEWKWMGCLMNDIPPFFIFIPWHSRMTSKWRNEEEWGWFWKWAKKLNSEMPLILSSFGHLVIIQERAHYFQSKRQVWPPITLCRGWWGARLLKNASLLATDPLDLNVLNSGMTAEWWNDKGMIIPPSFCH